MTKNIENLKTPFLKVDSNPEAQTGEIAIISQPNLSQSSQQTGDWDRLDILRFGVPTSLYCVLAFTRYESFDWTVLRIISNALLNGFLYRESIKSNTTEARNLYQKLQANGLSSLIQDGWLNFLGNASKLFITLNLTAAASLLLTGDVLAHQNNLPPAIVWIFGMLGFGLEGMLSIGSSHAVVQGFIDAASCRLKIDFESESKSDPTNTNLFISRALSLTKLMSIAVISALSFFFSIGTVGSMQRAANWTGLSWMLYPFPLLRLLNIPAVAPIAGAGIFCLFSYYVSKSMINLLNQNFCQEKFHLGNTALRLTILGISIASTLASSAIQIEGQAEVLSWNNAWSSVIKTINHLHITPSVLAGFLGGVLNVYGINLAIDKFQENYRKRFSEALPGTAFQPISWKDKIASWVTPVFDTSTGSSSKPSSSSSLSPLELEA